MLRHVKTGPKSKLRDEVSEDRRERGPVAAVRAVEDVQDDRGDEGAHSDSRISSMALEEAEGTWELKDHAREQKVRASDRKLKIREVDEKVDIPSSRFNARRTYSLEGLRVHSDAGGLEKTFNVTANRTIVGGRLPSAPAALGTGYEGYDFALTPMNEDERPLTKSMNVRK
ncbi:uncharacterized protein PHACADRAFT_189610 [Phanerochaete carnosa HHB-10118-sp]|uniref:Uncharacterized protein n=1 Tax=Phanerochaete carnosa (strain HHB-10118-sp) TaxID=650164 RepID=K5WM16_PHACS|nr:uncharacterized protein PHACADRAFT_189610 [Phanerochaete carnosa HHB-10118-sp]EKM60475.1 hypothetical protein PHACADRAFT_189610 [Phanerochaete carnosa HHB-10118-sp]